MSLHTLGTVCSYIVDCEHKTSPPDPTGQYFAVGTPAMKGNVIDFGQARRISEWTFETWTRRLRPRRGDLLLAREAPVGPVVRIPDEENVAPGQRTVLLRPDPGLVHSAFLYYLLTSPRQQELLKVKAAGSTVAHLNVADVRALSVALLPLPEQVRVAEVLGALDDKIAANAKLQRTAGDLARTLVLKAVVPGGYQRLDCIGSISMGSSPPGESLNELGMGILFHQGVRDFGFRSPTPRIWTSNPIRLAHRGDILVSVRAPVGSVNIAATEIGIGRGVAAVKSTTSQPWILFHLLAGFPTIWAPFEAEGTIFPSINRDQLCGLMIPKVRQDQEVLVEHTTAALEAMISSSLVEDVRLRELRDTLLPALMSGELRVKDAEQQVEAVV